MTQDNIPENIKIKKAECFRCGGIRNCDIKGYDWEGDWDQHADWERQWYLLRCRGCDYIFCQTIYTSSDELEYDEPKYSEAHGLEEKYKEVENIEYWPSRSARKRPEWMDTHSSKFPIEGESSELYEALNELYVALDNGLLMLAGIGVRTAFDVAAAALKINCDLIFQKKLDDLLKNNQIDQTTRNRLGIVVKCGNASAHRGWRPRLEELNIVVDVLEHFVDNNIIDPMRKEKEKADQDKKDKTLETLGKKIPDDPRKKKIITARSH